MYLQNNTKQQNQLKNFFDDLFTCGIIEIRPIGEGKQWQGKGYKIGQRRWYKSSVDLYRDINKIIIECAKSNRACFFGVLPRAAMGKAKKADIQAGNVLFSDVDNKDTGGWKESQKAIKELAIKPSYIIKTGGGYHLYYLTKDTIETELIEALNKSLAIKSKGDSTFDCTRILRVPFSYHVKDNENHKLVEMVDINAYRYSSSELIKWLKPQVCAVKQVTIPAKRTVITNKSLQWFINKWPSIGDYFNNVGKRTGKKSKSEYDYVFCKELLFRNATESFVKQCLREKCISDQRKKSYSYIEKTVNSAFLALNKSVPDLKFVESVPQKDDNVPQELDQYCFKDVHTPKLEDLQMVFNKSQGRIEPSKSLVNCEMILNAINEKSYIGDKRDFKYLMYNEFKNVVDIKGQPIEKTHLTNLALNIAKQYEVEFQAEKLASMVALVAKKNMYHPVKNYFKHAHTQYDPNNSILDSEDGFLGSYFKIDFEAFGIEDIVYLSNGETITKEEQIEQFKTLIKAMGKKWLISGVARIMKSPCKVDTSLILVGPQGLGKSEFFKTMAIRPEWFSDSKIDLRKDKDAYSKLQGKLIYEFAELADTKKRDSNMVKAFLSSQTDQYRPVYGKYDLDVPRQCIFGGTSNEKEILRDSTGLNTHERRFWVVPVLSVKWEKLKKDIDRIWGEAYHLAMNKKEQWWLTKEEESIMNDYQNPFKSSDSWMEIIEKENSIDITKGAKSLAYIMREWLKLDPSQQNRAAQMRLAGLLHGSGWKKVRIQNKWSWKK